MQRKRVIPAPGGRYREVYEDRGPGRGVPRRTKEFGVAKGGKRYAGLPGTR